MELKIVKIIVKTLTILEPFANTFSVLSLLREVINFLGYPHQDECELFAKYVLPKFNNIHFSKKFNRVPKSNPDSPLGNGLRK